MDIVIRMKFLFLTPPKRSIVKEVLGVSGPPLGLGYLASIAESLGNDVRIIDPEASELNLGDLEKELSKFYPDVVGISTPTPSIYEAYKIAKLAKRINEDSKVLIGGCHATFCDDEILEQCKSIDIVVRGEGEKTLEELISKKFKDLREIKGITYREGNRIRRNEDRGLIKNLDDVPFPAYHLFPMDAYKAGGKKFSTMITSRGCPFSCVFCSSSKLFGKVWRGRSAENVVEEMRMLQDEYGIKEFEFLDDTFTLNKRRAIEISNLIRKEGMDVSFTCSSRADTINREVAEKLNKAGCHTIYIGVESGDPRILKKLKKGITLKQAADAIKLIKENDMNVVASFILGYFDEGVEEMRRTIEFSKRLNPDYAQYTIFTPYKGTEAYEIANSRDLFLTKDWRKFTTVDVVVKSRATPAQVKQMWQRAYLEFYLRPSYLFNSIRKKNFFVLKTIASSIKNLPGLMNTMREK